jgi:hypothetical protein
MLAFSAIFVLAVVVFYICAQGGAGAEAIYGVIGIFTFIIILGMLLASC